MPSLYFPEGTKMLDRGGMFSLNPKVTVRLPDGRKISGTAEAFHQMAKDEGTLCPLHNKYHPLPRHMTYPSQRLGGITRRHTDFPPETSQRLSGPEVSARQMSVSYDPPPQAPISQPIVIPQPPQAPILQPIIKPKAVQTAEKPDELTSPKLESMKAEYLSLQKQIFTQRSKIIGATGNDLANINGEIGRLESKATEVSSSRLVDSITG